MNSAAVLIAGCVLGACCTCMGPLRDAPPADPPVRAAVLNIGEPGAPADQRGNEIGVDIRAAEFVAAADRLAADGVTIVVLRLNAGRGTVEAAEEFSRSLREAFAARFRVVLWVEHGWNAGLVATWWVPEVCMMPGARSGDGRRWSTGCFLEEEARHVPGRLRALGREVSALAGRDPAILDAVLGAAPLSVHAGSDGTRQLRPDALGAPVLNREFEACVLDEELALQWGVSRGSARTRDELAGLLELGPVEWAGSGAAAVVETARESIRDLAASVKVQKRATLTTLLEARDIAASGRHARKQIKQAREQFRVLSRLLDRSPEVDRWDEPSVIELEVLLDLLQHERAGAIGNTARPAASDRP